MMPNCRIRFLEMFFVFVLALTAAGGGSLCAHTIPVSYLTIVPDKDFVHLELVLNPFDLIFFPEIDHNRNGRLDRDELARFEELGTRKLLEAIELRVEGREIAAEIAGASLASDSHHVILRAHYPVDAREVPIAVACKLTQVTRGGHLTSVRYINCGRRQSVVLDTETGWVSFSPSGAGAKPTAQSR
jgi:hypothetical protein